MIQILPEQFENILPLAVEWAEAKEKVILEKDSLGHIAPSTSMHSNLADNIWETWRLRCTGAVLLGAKCIGIFFISSQLTLS